MDRITKVECVRVQMTDCGDLWVQLPYRSDWIEKIRKVPGRAWEPKNKKWVIPINQESISALIFQFQEEPVEVVSPQLYHAFHPSRERGSAAKRKLRIWDMQGVFYLNKSCLSPR